MVIVKHILTALGVLCIPLILFTADGTNVPVPTTARMVHYSGKVQGVGFRATTAEIAKNHPVTGWVKNLPDGRVELLVEGSEEGVKEFLDAVRERWKDNIKKELIEEQKPTGRFKSFDVVR